jgi:hypothetical protein
MKILVFGLDVGDVDFHVDNAGVNAVNGSTHGLVKHRDTGGHKEGLARAGEPGLIIPVCDCCDVTCVTRYRDGTLPS